MYTMALNILLNKVPIQSKSYTEKVYYKLEGRGITVTPVYTDVTIPKEEALKGLAVMNLQKVNS